MNISSIYPKLFEHNKSSYEFTLRKFKYISSRMAIYLAKRMKYQYRLPSIVMGIQKVPTGYQIILVAGQQTITDIDSITGDRLITDINSPDFTTSTYCLISNDDFISIDINKPNRIVDTIFGKETLC